LSYWPNPLQGDAAATLAAAAPTSFAIAQAAPKVVVVGGGAGGATTAHLLKAGDPKLDVTLIEANPQSYVERGRIEKIHDLKNTGPRSQKGLLDWNMPVISNGRLFLRTPV